MLFFQLACLVTLQSLWKFMQNVHVFMDFTSPGSSVFLTGHSVTLLLYGLVLQEACWCLLLWPGVRSGLNFCGCWGLYEVVTCWCLLRGLPGKLSQLLWLLKCVSCWHSVGIVGNEMLIKYSNVLKLVDMSWTVVSLLIMYSYVLELVDIGMFTV